MYLLRGASEVVTPRPAVKPHFGDAMGVVDRRANTDILIEGDKIIKVAKHIENHRKLANCMIIFAFKIGFNHSKKLFF